MKNRSNALLVELLIVVMFFMLAATVLMQVFAKAHNLTSQARVIASAVAEAQSQADRLSASDDPEAALTAMGYVKTNDGWTLEKADYTATVTLSDGEDGLTRQELTVRDSQGSTLLTLPCSGVREVLP